MIKEIIFNYVSELEIDKEEKKLLRIKLLYDFFQDDYFKKIYKDNAIAVLNNEPYIITKDVQKIEGASANGLSKTLINFNLTHDINFENELDNLENEKLELYLSEEDFYNFNLLKNILKKSNNEKDFENLILEEFKKNKLFLTPYTSFFEMEYIENVLNLIQKENKENLFLFYKENNIYFKTSWNDLIDKDSDFFDKESKIFSLNKEKLLEEMEKFNIKRISKLYKKSDYKTHYEEIKRIIDKKIDPELFIFQNYSDKKELFLKDIKIGDEKDNIILYDNKLNLFYNNSTSSIYRGLSYGKESSYDAGSSYSKIYIGYHNNLELIGLLQATVRKNVITITSVCVAENYRKNGLVTEMYKQLYEVAENNNKVICTQEYSDTGIQKLPFLRKKMQENYPNVLHINIGYDTQEIKYKESLLKQINEQLYNYLQIIEDKIDLNKLKENYIKMLCDIDKSEILVSTNYYINKYFKYFNEIEKNESRIDFLNRVSNKEQYVTIQVEGTDEDFDYYKKRDFQSLFRNLKFKNEFENFFIMNDIKEISYDFLPKIELDYYELEDDNVVFDVTFNVNELYEAYKDRYKTNYIEVYRVEGKNNKGLYGQNIKIEDSDNRPAPHLDGDISLIFDGTITANDEYRRKFIFGFKNIEQLKEWIKDIDMTELEIKKYKVPDYYVVEGNKQIIFKEEESECLGITNINKLVKNKKLAIK